jgi:TolB-like protein/DNA-binding SARP family transcriptional activator
LFHLKLFGGISLEGPAGPLVGRAVQRHRLALLALLGLARSRGVTRDKLIGFLWPDADPERSRPLLSDSVYRINQAVDGEAITAVGDLLRLNPERISCDAAQFADAVDRKDWERAAALYSAPLLDGFFLTDAEEFERLVETERQRYAQDYARALEALAMRSTDSAAAVHWWRLLAAHLPHSSRAALELMRALERSGERAAAVQHARIYEQLMREQLGVEPDVEVLAYAEQLRRSTSLSTKAPATSASENASVEINAPEPVSEPAISPANRRRKFAAPVIGVLGLITIIALFVFTRRNVGADSAEPTSIVVLPFADQSPARDQEYFADGITEELMVKLAGTPRLNVVGRTTSFAFKGSTADTREIADRLNVDAILSGSVRRADNRLRVTAQLVDAHTGFEMWSETYDRETTDVLAIQDEISRTIVTRLRGRLDGTNETARDEAGTNDAEAYNLYLRGRFEWHKRTETGVRNALKYFQQAVQRAPGYARAHAGLGDAYAILGFYDYLPPRDAFPNAKVAAQRALQIDPALGEAHATLGYVALYYEWDWPQAEREFLRSIELYPGYSTGHQWYANHLTAMGRFDEAVREMRAAQDIDPLSLIANAALGWVLYYAGEYDRAIQQLDRTVELNPNFELAHLWRGLALDELGKFPEAIASLERAVQLSGGSSISTALLARTYARAGESAKARSIVAKLEERQRMPYTPAFEIAKVHAALGDRATALRWLERAQEERSHSIAFLMVDPQLQSLRALPEFEEMVREVKLPRPGQRAGR